MDFRNTHSYSRCSESFYTFRCLYFHF